MTPLISSIVFTKNRPLQLHGYLESLRRFLPSEVIQTYILYKPELFGAEYEACFAVFPDCKVIRETNFHQNFLSLFGSLNTKYILFGIDDLAYFDGVSLETVEKTFTRLEGQLFGFSLRLDKRQMPQDIAAINVKQENIDGQAVFAVDWTKGQTDSTRYPFELCATIYRTEDIRRLLTAVMSRNHFANRFLRPGSAIADLYGRIFKARKLYKRLGYFYNPNTLESWCCRYVQNHHEQFGRLLAFGKICASAIQINRVNTSTVNEVDDSTELMVEALNEKYKQGWRLDVDWLSQKPPQETHSDAAYFHLKKVL
jgi:hypothetical protein